MIRWMALFGLLCLTGVAVFALRPDPWDAADLRAYQDADALAGLAERAERINWYLTKDTTLLRVMIWDAQGDILYPPRAGMTPLSYDFSQDTGRRLTRLQRGTHQANWTAFDPAGAQLLHCRPRPALCLIYDRQSLEHSLGLRPGALTGPSPNRWISLGCAALACCCAAAAIALRRRRQTACAARLEIDCARHIAKRGDLEVALTPKDLKLLSVLRARAGEVVTKDELYDAGWGRDYMPNSRALDQQMITLRRKLDPNKSRPVLIETVRGVGYRLLP